MASDLSTLTQEGLCSTLNNLLGKTAILHETTKAHPKDLENKQVLKIESTFEFDSITSTWTFLIPALTASTIFNEMLGETSEPEEKIDSDIADAISEFVSNISGGLATAINGSGFDDLKNTKFTINSNEIIQADELIDDIDNIFKFKIDLEGRELNILIFFDNVILPFIDSISKSPQSQYNEIVEVETEGETEEEIPEAEEETSKEESHNEKTEETTSETATNEVSIDNIENQQDETSQEVLEDNKKNKKMKIIIITVASLLALVIITILVLFFTGAFEEEPPKQIEPPKPKTVLTKDGVEVVKYYKEEKTDIEASLINENRLNKKLALLTKNSVLTKEDIKKQKEEKEKRKNILSQQEKLEEFKENNKEESLEEEDLKVSVSAVTIDKVKSTNEVSKSSINLATTNNQEYKTIIPQKNYISLDTLKYKLYKELISKSNSSTARISICKNEKGRTTIYIGPFVDENIKNSLMDELKKINSIEVTDENLTNEQFDTRCSF